MRAFTLILLFALSTTTLAAGIDYNSAPGSALVECELMLGGPVQQKVLQMMFGNIGRFRQARDFGRFFSGVQPRALEVYGFKNGPVPFTLDVYQAPEGDFYLRLMSALKVIQNIRIPVDPTFAWRRYIKQEIVDAEGHFQIGFNDLLAGIDNGHVHGFKLPADRNGRRFIMFRPMNRNAVQIIFGLDVPCGEIDSYLKGESLAPVFLLSHEGSFCRLGVLHATFPLNTALKTD